ncbi:hypothetical protein CRE_31617 [Caenorhabditis remanei]|uniref:BBS2 hairpin domain-containing protein n=1 Tax=Caenorhabditis remanei TaxID=31234 RepID=E3NSB8_CAERE|nr:hypothetical protein CRE_31617 [Caenorhabditis remanei]
MDPMTEVRDRLTAELQERQAAVREVLIRAEDAIAIDTIPNARKFYIRLKANDAAARQAAQLRWNNQERCVKSLRRLNKIIENCSRLRGFWRTPEDKLSSLVELQSQRIINRSSPKVLQYGVSSQ